MSFRRPAGFEPAPRPPQDRVLPLHHGLRDELRGRESNPLSQAHEACEIAVSPPRVGRPWREPRAGDVESDGRSAPSPRRLRIRRPRCLAPSRQRNLRRHPARRSHDVAEVGSGARSNRHDRVPTARRRAASRLASARAGAWHAADAARQRSGGRTAARGTAVDCARAWRVPFIVNAARPQGNGAGRERPPLRRPTPREVGATSALGTSHVT